MFNKRSLSLSAKTIDEDCSKVKNKRLDQSEVKKKTSASDLFSTSSYQSQLVAHFSQFSEEPTGKLTPIAAPLDYVQYNNDLEEVVEYLSQNCVNNQGTITSKPLTILNCKSPESVPALNSTDTKYTLNIFLRQLSSAPSYKFEEIEDKNNLPTNMKNLNEFFDETFKPLSPFSFDFNLDANSMKWERNSSISRHRSLTPIVINNHDSQESNNQSENLFQEVTSTKSILEEMILNAGKSLESSEMFLNTLKGVEIQEQEGNVDEGCDIVEFPENCHTPNEKLAKGIESIMKNTNLIYSGSVTKSNQEQLKQKAKEEILRFFQNLTEKANGNEGLFVTLRNCSKNNLIFKDNYLQFKEPNHADFLIIKANNNCFHNLVFVLAKAYHLISTNSTCNQREIYYQNVNKFKTIRTLSDAIRRASMMLNIPPWILGITTTNKGLIYGKLIIMYSYRQTIECDNPQGTLIPSDLENIQYLESNAAFILIVEKDAIFQKLLQDDVPNKLAKPFLLITGKGFPDLNTRRMIRKLWMMLKIPVFILVDANPGGIEIMLTYRFGSMLWAHMNHELALPNIRWVGILPSEIVLHNFKSQKLTQRDRRKLQLILDRPYMSHCPRICEEIREMLKQGVKAEIEGVMKTDQFLSNVYLPNRFYTRDFV